MYSTTYQTFIRLQPISYLKWAFSTAMARGYTTRAAYIALAMARKIGPYAAQRIIGPRCNLRTMLQLVWLDTSKHALPAFLCRQAS